MICVGPGSASKMTRMFGLGNGRKTMMYVWSGEWEKNVDLCVV